MVDSVECARIPPWCLSECVAHIHCIRFDFCKRMEYDECGVEPDCDRDAEACRRECAAYSPCILCSDACDFRGDSECDDGGSGSSFEACPVGSDCKDCGVRLLGDAPPIPPAPPPSPPPLADLMSACQSVPASCSTCLAHVQCLQYLYCAEHPSDACANMGGFAGTCANAPRYCVVQCSAYAQCFLCTDSCDFRGDSECDDGGHGSEYGSCPLGTDCADCGPRGGSFLNWDGHLPPPPHLPPRPPPLPPPHPPPLPPPFPPPPFSPPPFSPPPPSASLRNVVAKESGSTAAAVAGWLILATLMISGLVIAMRRGGHRWAMDRLGGRARVVSSSTTTVPLASRDMATEFRLAADPPQSSL